MRVAMAITPEDDRKLTHIEWELFNIPELLLYRQFHDPDAERRKKVIEINTYLQNYLVRLADRWVDSGEEFLAAAEDADPERLEALAAKGAPVNYHDPWNGATALHYVAAQGARRAFRVLMKTGKCDFLARDDEGRLISEMAGAYGRDLVMERLLLMKEIRQARQTGVPLDHIYRRDRAVYPSSAPEPNFVPRNVPETRGNGGSSRRNTRPAEGSSDRTRPT